MKCSCVNDGRQAVQKCNCTKVEPMRKGDSFIAYVVIRNARVYK